MNELTLDSLRAELETLRAELAPIHTSLATITARVDGIPLIVASIESLSHDVRAAIIEVEARTRE